MVNNVSMFLSVIVHYISIESTLKKDSSNRNRNVGNDSPRIITISVCT